MSAVCDLCTDRQGRDIFHEEVFVSSRTGQASCAECIRVLLSWEEDGKPEPDGDYERLAWMSEVRS